MLAHYSVMLGCGVMAAGERPLRNVVVILSDDHALKVTGAYGNSIVRTPSIDRLASEGVTFATYLQDNLAMVCTQEWKYVFHTGSRDLGINYATGYGPAGLTERLYDLKNDPLEQRDVSGSPENESIFKNMRQSLLRRFMETHPDAEDCPSELNTIGKLVWFCEPRDIGDDQMAEDIPTRVFESR